MSHARQERVAPTGPRVILEEAGEPDGRCPGTVPKTRDTWVEESPDSTGRRAW